MNVREKLRKIENKAEKFKKGNKYKSRKFFFFKVCAWKKKKFCCVSIWLGKYFTNGHPLSWDNNRNKQKTTLKHCVTSNFLVTCLLVKKFHFNKSKSSAH